MKIALKLLGLGLLIFLLAGTGGSLNPENIIMTESGTLMPTVRLTTSSKTAYGGTTGAAL